MPFKCTQCGACCKILPRLVAPWLVDESGVCRHLKDNKCTIYDNRPDICNRDKMRPLYNNLTDSEYDELSEKCCKELEELANVKPE